MYKKEKEIIENTLLVEIGTEEIPSRFLREISEQFYKNMKKQLEFYNIQYENIQSFFTPRRLALKILKIDTTEKIFKIHKKGPSILHAYDKFGAPTKTANNWAKHYGIKLEEAIIIKNKKGRWLSCEIIKKQEKVTLLFPKIIEKSLEDIFLLKPMRWEIEGKKFVRPIRNIVILLNDQIIKGNVFNIESRNYLQNHLSFQNKKIKINHTKEYPLILFKQNKIIADFELRKKNIIEKSNEITKKINGFIKDNNVLFEEITALVESPKTLLASFKKKFLEIPEKILVYIIEKQQKCFSIYDVNKKILPYFVFVSNIDSKTPKNIILGCEKVMHARLSDAEFFLKKDKKIRLESYFSFLKNVLFQKNLGSLYDKSIRIQKLIKWISQYTSIKKNQKDLIRAAFLSKCDLVTNMVSEFPDLQGTIGMYYSIKDKEKKDISIALEEQYLPLFSKDQLPKTCIGSFLSIVDKTDTVTGMFSVGKFPSANKDPFALRRLSIGIFRIIIKNNISLDLTDLIKKSLSLHKKEYEKNIFLLKQITDFFVTRLFHWYEEIGYNKKIIQSVLSGESIKPMEIEKKIKALAFFQTLDYSKSIILSIKRILNILKKENTQIFENIDTDLLNKNEEVILFNQTKKFYNETKNLFLQKQYKEILLKTKDLEYPIHNFFNNIKIHHFNPKIRNNRLYLLNELKKIFLKIANFSNLY